jgi:hypothetical protein
VHLGSEIRLFRQLAKGPVVREKRSWEHAEKKGYLTGRPKNEAESVLKKREMSKIANGKRNRQVVNLKQDPFKNPTQSK